MEREHLIGIVAIAATIIISNYQIKRSGKNKLKEAVAVILKSKLVMVVQMEVML